MPYKRRYSKKPAKKKVVKASNGNKVPIDTKDRSGLSLREYKAVKKMLPRVEVKMAPLGIFGVQSAPYTVSNELPNIPIIGQTTITGLGFVKGVDYITQGTGDGDRIGGRIYPKRLNSHIQWCVDENKSASDIDPGPYQVRWWIYRVKNTYSALGDGGLPQAQNTTFKTWYDDGNNQLTAPIGNVTDMYRRMNTSMYTIHKQGVFCIQPTQRRLAPSGEFSAIPLLKGQSGAFHHVYVDLTRFCAKTLKYIDDPQAPIDQNCTNDAMYLTYTVSRYDNQPITQQFYLNCTMINTLYFTDS